MSDKALAGRASPRASGQFYGKKRIKRSNEAWDTLDPRLVEVLVSAMPRLRERMVWEPAAGCGTMVDQLELCGVRVFGATDIEPRRDDIGKLDIFESDKVALGCTAIVTNPPWGRLCAPFVRHAVALAQRDGIMACMLVALPWITGRKVSDLTGHAGFDVMIVPRFRARWMTEQEEADLEDGPQAPKMNHVWLVWDFAREAGAARVLFVP